MKKSIKSFVSLLLITLCVMSLYSCTEIEQVQTTANSEVTENLLLEDLHELWKNAVYTENKEFGNGSKTLTVKVTAAKKTIVFTIKTDKSTVGEALLEHDLISGDAGEYGLYIKTVNGILADYSVDQSYWAFYIGENYAMTGVDSTEITEDNIYKLEHTK